MSRGTSYNAIKEAIEAGERLTRAQGKSLLDILLQERKQKEQDFARALAAERQSENLNILYEMEREYAIKVTYKYNSMLEMLNGLLGVRVMYDEGVPVAEQYKQALKEKFGVKS